MPYSDLTKTASGRSALAMILAALAGFAGGRVLGDSRLRGDIGHGMQSFYRNDIAPLARSGGAAISDWYRQDLRPALRSGGNRAVDWYNQAIAPRIDPAIGRVRNWAEREIIPRANATWTTIQEARGRAFGR